MKSKKHILALIIYTIVTGMPHFVWAQNTCYDLFISKKSRFSEAELASLTEKFVESLPLDEQAVVHEAIDFNIKHSPNESGLESTNLYNTQWVNTELSLWKQHLLYLQYELTNLPSKISLALESGTVQSLFLRLQNKGFSDSEKDFLRTIQSLDFSSLTFEISNALEKITTISNKSAVTATEYYLFSKKLTYIFEAAARILAFDKETYPLEYEEFQSRRSIYLRKITFALERIPKYEDQYYMPDKPLYAQPHLLATIRRQNIDTLNYLRVFLGIQVVALAKQTLEIDGDTKSPSYNRFHDEFHYKISWKAHLRDIFLPILSFSKSKNLVEYQLAHFIFFSIWHEMNEINNYKGTPAEIWEKYLKKIISTDPTQDLEYTGQKRTQYEVLVIRLHNGARISPDPLIRDNMDKLQAVAQKLLNESN